MIPRTAALRAVFFAGWTLLAFAAISRACAVPAGGVRIYLPSAGQERATCDYRRNPWDCYMLTTTAIAAVSQTPSATFRPWSSPTPMASSTPRFTPIPPPIRRLPLTGGPRSVALDGRDGHCAPMADGCYTAAHVLRGARSVSIGGQPARWSVDPTRDLAHVAAYADPSVTLRAAEPSEILRWSNDRASGLWRVVGASDGAVTVCSVEGWVVYGDSGTGAYGVDDGALVGILTNAALSGDWRDSLACSDGGQQGRLEQVP